MRNILGRHRLRAVAAAAAVLALTATPSAGTTQNAGTTHNHDSHVHSANAAVASAEPDHTATLNRAKPTFTWEGSGSGAVDPSGFFFSPGPNTPLRCKGTPFRCDDVLLLVEKAGELTLTLDGEEDGDVSDPTGQVCGDSPCTSAKDIDGRLYRSSAAGDPVGKTLTKNGCVTPSSSETCKVAVGPGFYVVEVEYYQAVEAHYIGTVELVAPPGPPAAQPQTVTVEGCNFTLYYFKDSAERLQALVPPGYRVAPYFSYGVAGQGSPLVTTEGSATIAAHTYDCDRIEVPGSSPAPGIFTLLSVLVYPTDGTFEGPATADFYVLWIHADNPQLVELLASRDMPAYLVPGMVFEKPLQSVAVRVEVPWSPSPYELATTGFVQDLLFHSHDNTFLHEAADCHEGGAGPGRRGCLVRMDFVTNRARDQYCSHPADQNQITPTDAHHAVECGQLTADSGTPVASFFGAPDRTADTAWDHDPVERSWFFLE